MLPQDRDETRRWTRALLLVLGLHAAPLAVAAYWLGPLVSAPPAESAVLVDMAPPAAPPAAPSEQPPGPKQVKAEIPGPKAPEDVAPTPPVPNPAVAMPAPQLAPPPMKAGAPALETTAPPARPLPPAPVASNAAPTWQGLVLGQLNRFKRYPGAAQARRQQGVPYIRFVIDRNGKVLTSRLERSSGFAALDAEAVALPRRAQPLPKPPPEVSGQSIELVVPVEFFIRS